MSAVEMKTVIVSADLFNSDPGRFAPEAGAVVRIVQADGSELVLAQAADFDGLVATCELLSDPVAAAAIRRDLPVFQD